MKRLKLEWDMASAYVDGYHAAMGEPAEFVPGMLPDYLQKYWDLGYTQGQLQARLNYHPEIEDQGNVI